MSTIVQYNTYKLPFDSLSRQSAHDFLLCRCLVGKKPIDKYTFPLQHTRNDQSTNINLELDIAVVSMYESKYRGFEWKNDCEKSMTIDVCSICQV